MKFSLLILLVLVLGCIFWAHTKAGCELSNGRWASNGSYCVTLNCFESGNCGNWANPSLWCNELAIGDPVEKVYFKLGNPSFIRGNNYTWQASKASTDVITAQIVNNTLSRLVCPNPRL